MGGWLKLAAQINHRARRAEPVRAASALAHVAPRCFCANLAGSTSTRQQLWRQILPRPPPSRLATERGLISSESAVASAQVSGPKGCAALSQSNAPEPMKREQSRPQRRPLTWPPLPPEAWPNGPDSIGSARDNKGPLYRANCQLPPPPPLPLPLKLVASPAGPTRPGKSDSGALHCQPVGPSARRAA